MDIKSILKLPEKEFLKRYSYHPEKIAHNSIKKGDLVKRVGTNSKHNIFKVVDFIGEDHVITLDLKNDVDYYNKLKLKLIDIESLFKLKREIIEDSLFNIDIEKVMKFLDFGLSKVMDRDSYEITRSGNLIELVVYYGDIPITNSLGTEHVLRDVYVRFSLNYNGESGTLYLYEIGMKRTTYEEKELGGTVYQFSHISSNNLLEWNGDFCYGTTDFSNRMYNLQNERHRPYEFIYMIEQFRSYLSWESIEGVPYRHLSVLSTNKIAEYTPSPKGRIPVNALVIFYEYLLYNENFKRFTYNFSNRNDIIINLLDHEIKEELIAFWKENGLPTAYLKDGVYYSDNKNINRFFSLNKRKYENKSVLTFKGQEKLFKIIYEDEPDISSYELTIHPEDLNYVLSHFTENFEKELIKLSIYGR